MENTTESTLNVPHSKEIGAVGNLLNDALVQCWKILERLFTRTDAPYY